jgi:exopolysaccharide biosynthesis polyprenyl glycosylphosphotransferase
LVVAISKIAGLYDRDEVVLHKTTLEEAPQLFQVATLLCLIFWLWGNSVAGMQLGSDQILGFWVALFVLLVCMRTVARAVAGRTTAPERCLLLGDPAVCERAKRKLNASSALNAEVVWQVTSPRIGEAEVPLAKLAELARCHRIERVIVAPRSTDHGDVLNLMRAIKTLGLNVSVIPRVLEVVGSAVVVDDVDGVLILGVRRFGLTRSSQITKRATDILVAFVGLALLSPVLAVIAAVIKLDSSGPLLFRQQRVGKDGRPFKIVKFRTMVADADQRKAELLALSEVQGLFKITDDPRITRVGRILRRSSLDELPQLWNVLRGEMSLVGPRPLVDEEDSRIEGWDRGRLSLTPGMTGPWQVLGAGRIPLAEMVKLDYLYVATWSLWGDAKILLRTAGLVLRRQGI